MQYIADFKEGDRVVEHFLCKQKSVLKTRGGKSYYSLVLQDKTGTVDAKVWDLSDQIHDFDTHDYIKIDAMVVTFQNDYQLNVKKIRRSTEGEYDPKDYIPVSNKDIDEMYESLKKYVHSVKNKFIKNLLVGIFIDDEAFIKKFKFHSAAKNIHHGYMGGLLEHTLSVVEICEFLSGRYYFVERDLLIAGAMLHDIGKVHELSPLPLNEYTDEGQLTGHIIIGLEYIIEKMSEIKDFPKEIATLIKHMVLSHHGELEYGSPKVPQTIEAMIIHCADNMDAKVKCFEETIMEDTTEGMWTNYHRMLQRNIRRTNI
ncbi:3'-5' exoribonuclease YhaM family protein [Vallitalea okinawensis]|uniref:3'-5' exoribonuclease YhaM family protein n=1 Tax=Vallitalea okinawensis TaxID=2078660 RepID=UPI000CFC3078|nr:HD domain-containing protein [Vallitalea okinawensis]